MQNGPQRLRVGCHGVTETETVNVQPHQVMPVDADVQQHLPLVGRQGNREGIAAVEREEHARAHACLEEILHRPGNVPVSRPVVEDAVLSAAEIGVADDVIHDGPCKREQHLGAETCRPQKVSDEFVGRKRGGGHHQARAMNQILRSKEREEGVQERVFIYPGRQNMLLGDSNRGELNRLRVVFSMDITLEVEVYKIGEDRCRKSSLSTFPLSCSISWSYHKKGF